MQRQWCCVVALLLAMQPAGAVEFGALMKAQQYAEAEHHASARLAKDSSDAAAMADRVDAILAAGGEARTALAVKQAEQCVAVHPDDVRCQLALGYALGTRISQGGAMAAIGSAGTMREAFEKAVHLAPRNVDARFALLRYYTLAPAIAGGGSARAAAFVVQTAPVLPQAATLMQATLNLADGKLASAEASALGLDAGADPALLERQQTMLLNLGVKYLGDKQPADAERVFRAALKRFPDGDNTPYWIARSEQEQGRHREALAALGQVLIKSERAAVHYRIGQSLQALGDTAKAIAAYEKALSFDTGLSQKSRTDAQAQLKALKN